MSAPTDIKPATPKRPRRPAKPRPIQAVELSDEERRLGERFAMALRRMDAGHRKAAVSLVDVVEDLAIKYPRHAAPALHLVVGGAR